MPRSLALDPAHSRNCHAEWLSQSILETSAPPNSASLYRSAQSGIQSGDASSATLARAALCACRSCPSLDATSALVETLQWIDGTPVETQCYIVVQFHRPATRTARR